MERPAESFSGTEKQCWRPFIKGLELPGHLTDCGGGGLSKREGSGLTPSISWFVAGWIGPQHCVCRARDRGISDLKVVFLIFSFFFFF